MPDLLSLRRLSSIRHNRQAKGAAVFCSRSTDDCMVNDDCVVTGDCMVTGGDRLVTGCLVTGDPCSSSSSCRYSAWKALRSLLGLGQLGFGQCPASLFWERSCPAKDRVPF